MPYLCSIDVLCTYCMYIHTIQVVKSMEQECAVLQQHQKTCSVLKHLTLFIASVYILLKHLTQHWPQVHTPWTRFQDNVMVVIASAESVGELRVEVKEQLDNSDNSIQEPLSLFSGVKGRLIRSIIDRLAL